MSVTEPSKILTPWATSGLKNTIPQSANPVTGNAGFDQGFPAINMTAKEAGGIPPYGQDFNGILFDITKSLQYTQAGGVPTYSEPLSTAVGGYGKGAVLLSTNGITMWKNILAGNTSDPDAGGAGWVDLVLSILPKRSFTANDYIRIPDVPGGLIIQFGGGTVNATTANQTVTITYPVQFPNACLSNILTHSGNAIGSAGNNRGYIMSCEQGTNSSFQSSYSASSSVPIIYKWISVGF